MCSKMYVFLQDFKKKIDKNVYNTWVFTSFFFLKCGENAWFCIEIVTYWLLNSKNP